MKKKPGLAVTIIDVGGPKKGKKMKDEIVLDDEEDMEDEEMEEYDDLEMEDEEEDFELDEEDDDKAFNDMFKDMEPGMDEDTCVEGMMTAVKEDDKEAFKEHLKAFIKMSIENQ